MINILITGGAGNVGSALAKRLVVNDNYFVVIVDNLRTGSISKLPDHKYLNFKLKKSKKEIECLFRLGV